MRIIATLLVLGAWASMAGAQNLLLDSSFDASTPASQTNPNWTLDVNFPDGVGSAAQFQDAPWASNPRGTDGIGVWFKAFEGNQAGSGDPLANVTLYQEVAAPAGDYKVSFAFLKELNYMSENTFVELLDAGTRIGLLDLTDVAGGDAFQDYSFTGTSTGGMLRVQAKMVNGFDSLTNPQSAMFDDFSLVAVPEPSSLVLMLVGILAIGCRRPRR